MGRSSFFSLVEDRLLQVEDRMRLHSNGHHPDLQNAMEHLVKSGGKRVRPTIILLIGKILGGDPNRFVTLSAAVELLHTATLVHDDLIDGALLRRGMPTLNAQWSPAATVLAGDYFFARAAELSSETESIELMRLFANTLVKIVGGEINQLFASRGVVSRENYYTRIHEKTASMFVLSSQAAAILGGADDGVLTVLRDYGHSVGMAFQIMDDVLDFTGEQSKVGKPVASDLRQGLITLPTIYYHEEFPNDPELELILSGEYLEDAAITSLVDRIRAGGSIDLAINEAKELIDRSIQGLDILPTSKFSQALYTLAEYVLNRKL